MTDHPTPPATPGNDLLPASTPGGVPPEGRSTTVMWVGLLLIGVLAIAIVLVLQIGGGLAASATLTATPMPGISDLGGEPRPLTDFALPASTGSDLTLSSFGQQGQYTMMFFGYTHCPDFCPTTLAEFRLIKLGLGDLAARVQFVMVSVDAARDTPPYMAAYLERFDPSFIGLSGDDETLMRITPDFGLFYERHEDQGENYLVDHSTPSYLIDPDMNLRAIFSYSASVEDIVSHMMAVMGEPEAVALAQ